MSELIRVPDIGGEGEVIEILVEEGQRIEAEQSLVVLESDKASMEVPAPRAGVIRSLKFRLGDKLKEGDPLLELDDADEQTSSGTTEDQKPTEPSRAAQAEDTAESGEAVDEAEATLPAAEEAEPDADASTAPPGTDAPGQKQVNEVRVPDIGGDGKAQVIEVLVRPGDAIELEQSLVVLESEKASMEIPSPAAGVVESVEVGLNDQVGTGDLLLRLRSAGAKPAPEERRLPSEPAVAADEREADRRPAPTARSEAPAPVGAPSRDGAKVHAGPAVRQLARELGVDLSQVSGTGPKERILKEDVQQFVKQRLSQPAAGPAQAAAPVVDFSRFGEIEEVPLSRLRQIAAGNLQRNWPAVPQVTQFDSADITELEAFRIAQKARAEQAGVKLTLLPLLLKACAQLLHEMPDFNSSLAPSGQALIHKKYLHIGFAVDTPEGLLVPVIRDVDRKGLLALAGEAAELADKARRRKLGPDAMQGGCFTISSLGHIGGTGFTPLVNAPEVAILGVSRAAMQPIWDGNAFQPRLMLPLSLSYDHRVINGAAAAQFTRRLGELLGDIRQLLL